uniref:Uncharacterized protein n=1 Tax=Oryza brachyantha TaxID=4533 RepID=J3MLE8_ORYBR
MRVPASVPLQEIHARTWVLARRSSQRGFFFASTLTIASKSIISKVAGASGKGEITHVAGKGKLIGSVSGGVGAAAHAISGISTVDTERKEH